MLITTLLKLSQLANTCSSIYVKLFGIITSSNPVLAKALNPNSSIIFKSILTRLVASLKACGYTYFKLAAFTAITFAFSKLLFPISSTFVRSIFIKYLLEAKA